MNFAKDKADLLIKTIAMRYLEGRLAAEAERRRLQDHVALRSIERTSRAGREIHDDLYLNAALQDDGSSKA